MVRLGYERREMLGTLLHSKSVILVRKYGMWVI